MEAAGAVTTAHAKLALNFFYFLLADEALAITASSQAIHAFKKAHASQGDVKMSSEALLIRQLLKVLRKIKSKPKLNQIIGTHTLAKTEWDIPNQQSMARWKEFLYKSDGAVEPVLVLRYILDVPVKVISEAMHAPEGTVLYRLGRGLELLSTI